jgi:IclR family acetate operon transcriptional repressor
VRSLGQVAATRQNAAVTARRSIPSGSALVRNESLRRGLLVLRALVRADAPVSAAEVARRTGIPGPTVARLLATLADEAMAMRDADGGWCPGPAVAELAGADSGVADMVARAGEVLRELANATGESALLTQVRLPDTAEALVQEDADRLLGATRWVGRITDPRQSVAGWVTAATLDEDAVASMGGEDPIARERWLAHVAEARSRGYAVDIDGLEAGLTSLAVSVPSAVRGMAVGMAGPSARLTPEQVLLVVPLMHRAAGALASVTQ